MSTLAEPAPITASELTAFAEVNAQAFASPTDPAELELNRKVLELDRTLVCRATQADGVERIVGTATAFSYTLSVPGAELPAAGVTAVGVLPTHRRRGVLTALMRRQLIDVAARGEPLAVLFASEPGIYRRYGYGPAATGLALSIPQPTARMVPVAPAGELVVRPATEARAELALVYDVVQPGRPGYYHRGEAGWLMRLFDPPSRREGATELQAVLHLDAAGSPNGYALYQTKGRFGATGPDGEANVSEVVASDPSSAAALWRYLLELDLMTRVNATVAPDDPILALLIDPYAAAPRVSDNLWVRVIDLPTALVGRRYAASVDLTLEVTDPLLPANNGRWRLTSEPGPAAAPSCTRTDRQPDLALRIDELGAVYLGGPSLASLSAAGQVQLRRPTALPAASAAFGWVRQPFCPQLF